VTWDADGAHFGRGPGLRVAVDGREVAVRPTFGRITIPMARLAPPLIDRPVNRAVQLVRGAFPRPGASGNMDAESLHDAVDGRIWYFPEMPNGWTSPKESATPWFTIDFGKALEVSRAELAFAAGNGVVAPLDYTVERWTGTAWRALGARKQAPRGNGVTHVAWPAVATDRIRVSFRVPRNEAMRLVELKIF
jgi:hypothetical protein